MSERARAHTAPRTAIVWSVLLAETERRAREGHATLRVLDVGGGSGVLAVPLAELGHSVTVVDTSADALATLERRARESGVRSGVTPVQGEVDDLGAAIEGQGYDLVLCHGLLEVVDDPQASLVTLAGVLRPGGRLSVLVANRAATVLARALGGHINDALRALRDPNGRWSESDAIRRRFDSEGLRALLAAAGLRLDRLHGVGVVADLVPGGVLDGVPGATEALRELELIAAAQPPYSDVATQLHALAAVPDS